jgi:flagellar assembly protein FliH
MAVGDCRIEWADGGVARDRAATEAAIVEAIDRFVAMRRGGAGA